MEKHITTEYGWTKDEYQQLQIICGKFTSVRSRLDEARKIFDWVKNYEDAVFIGSLIDKIEANEDPFKDDASVVLKSTVENFPDKSKVDDAQVLQVPKEG